MRALIGCTCATFEHILSIWNGVARHQTEGARQRRRDHLAEALHAWCWGTSGRKLAHHLRRHPSALKSSVERTLKTLAPILQERLREDYTPTDSAAALAADGRTRAEVVGRRIGVGADF